MNNSKLEKLIQEELALYKEEQSSLVLNEEWEGSDWFKLAAGIAAAVVGRRAIGKFLKPVGRVTSKQAKNLAKLEGQLVKVGAATKKALDTPLSKIRNSTQKLYDDVDDFIAGGGKIISRGKIDKTKLNTIKSRMESNANKIISDNNNLQKELEGLIKSTGGDEKAALKAMLKQAKNQEKNLLTIKSNISAAESADEISAVALAISKKGAAGPAAKLAMAAKYGGKTAQAGRAARMAGRAVAAPFVGLWTLRWALTLGLASHVSEYIFRFILYPIGKLFGEGAVELIYNFVKGNLVESAIFLYEVTASLFGEGVATAQEMLNQDQLKKLFSGGPTKDADKRVSYMKSLIANLSMLKMLPNTVATGLDTSYSEELAKVKKFFDDFDYGVVSFKEETIKQNMRTAVGTALQEIHSTEFSFVKFINTIEASDAADKLTPSAVESMEYLYQAYFFAALKQKFPNLEIDQEALFSSPQSRQAALESVINSLKEAEASPAFIRMIEKIKDGKAKISSSPKLKNFVISKYFTGGESAKVNAIKNKAATEASRDLIQIFN